MTVKNIKLYILAILVFIGLIGLCACDKKTAEKNDDIPTLVVGSDEYPPFIYYDTNGEFTGIDVDIARAACERIGYSVKFKTIKWDEKDTYLNTGKVDCLWGSFSMNGRDNDYMWVGPYMTSNQSVAVMADSDIYTISDLDGKKIAVQSSSKPEQYFLQRKSDDVPDVKTVYSFVETDEVFAALQKGYVDACTGHFEMLESHIKKSPNRYRILKEPLFVSKLGVAFPKYGDKQLANKISDVIVEMKNDGTIDKILSEYGMITDGD